MKQVHFSVGRHPHIVSFVTEHGQQTQGCTEFLAAALGSMMGMPMGTLMQHLALEDAL